MNKKRGRRETFKTVAFSILHKKGKRRKEEETTADSLAHLFSVSRLPSDAPKTLGKVPPYL